MNLALLSIVSLMALTALGSETSKDCVSWKQNDQSIKSEFFLKEEGSFSFVDETDQLMITDLQAGALLALKTKEFVIVLNGKSGFSFGKSQDLVSKKNMVNLAQGLAEFSKGWWTVSKNGRRISRIEVNDQTSKFMALYCNSLKSCIVVDRDKKKYDITKSSESLAQIQKQFQTEILEGTVEKICRALQAKKINQTIEKFDLACLKSIKSKLSDENDIKKACEEVREIIKPLIR